MRVFLYECKKILNIKLLLLLAVFTWFYVQTYYVQIVGFPGIVPGADGITYISKTLRDKVGTTLNKSEFYLLDEILEDMLRDKNKLIQESEILAVEGITDSVQMDEVREEYYLRMDQGDEHARQVIAEMDRIIFLDGPLENRVEDQIRALYEEL